MMRLVSLLAVVSTVVSVADPVIPLDFTWIGTDVTIDVDPSLSRDLGARPALADCAAECARDPNCESLRYSSQSCVLFYIRPCQTDGLLSAPGSTVLEKSADVPIAPDRVIMQDIPCGQYVNGTVITTYEAQIPATFDNAMNNALTQFQSDCRAHCAKTTFCQSYTVAMQYDAVPVNAALRCTTYSDSIYSSVDTIVSVTQCKRQQLTYGVVGGTISQLNCGQPSRTPQPIPTGTPAGYAMVGSNEYMDTDPQAVYHGVLSATSCAEYCSNDVSSYSSISGSWTFYGDIYEKIDPVTIPSDQIIFQTQCGTYTGVQIASADISNSTDFNQDCHHLCSRTSAPFSCMSWQVQYVPIAMGPNLRNVTCNVFADSLFRTSPLGGYYSTRRGLCPDNPGQKSVYGILGAASSVFNCGRTPRPTSSAKSPGGLVPGPGAVKPNPPQQQQQAPPVDKAGVAPTPASSPHDQDSSQSALSVVVALITAVLALVMF